MLLKGTPFEEISPEFVKEGLENKELHAEVLHMTGEKLEKFRELTEKIFNLLVDGTETPKEALIILEGIKNIIYDKTGVRIAKIAAFHSEKNEDEN